MTEDSRGMGEEREAIARIIDNGAFIVPKHPAPDDGFWRGQRKHAALDKADGHPCRPLSPRRGLPGSGGIEV